MEYFDLEAVERNNERFEQIEEVSEEIDSEVVTQIVHKETVTPAILQ